MDKRRISDSIAFFFLCCLSETCLAESNGNVGGTSTGSAAISVTIPKLIKVKSFSDLPLGTYAGTAELNGNDDLNISTNYGAGSGRYRVTANGSGAGGTFTLTDGVDTIAYNAYYNDNIGTAGRAAIRANHALTEQHGATETLSTSTLNANISVRIIQASIQAADPGFYSGTITFVFTPE